MVRPHKGCSWQSTCVACGKGTNFHCSTSPDKDCLGWTGLWAGCKGRGHSVPAFYTGQDVSALSRTYICHVTIQAATVGDTSAAAHHMTADEPRVLCEDPQRCGVHLNTNQRVVSTCTGRPGIRASSQKFGPTALFHVKRP